MIYKSYQIEQNIFNLDKNLFLFYGENFGLQEDIKNKLINNHKKIEIIKFNQEDILKNQKKFFNEIFNISLFENEKFFFISQVNDKLLQVIEDLEDKIDSQKLYFFSGLLDKKSKIRNFFEKSNNCGAVACYADNEISIKKLIFERLKGFEGLSAQNINLIIQNSNLDRIKLKNELNKIVSYFQNKKIETKKLEILFDFRINENFNSLKDEALNGNKSKTNELLSETIIESEKNIFYLALINQRLNKLSETLKISRDNNFEAAMNELRPPIFWKDKPIFMNQAKKWDINKIKNVLNKTYNLEIKIKSNTIINKNLLVKKLIVDICEMANAS
jgi:DNA polymerase III subunit delta